MFSLSDVKKIYPSNIWRKIIFQCKKMLSWRLLLWCIMELNECTQCPCPKWHPKPSRSSSEPRIEGVHNGRKGGAQEHPSERQNE